MDEAAALPSPRVLLSRRLKQELYPNVVDAPEEEGGVPSRLLKTEAGDGRQEGTPWKMFAGSPTGSLRTSSMACLPAGHHRLRSSATGKVRRLPLQAHPQHSGIALPEGGGTRGRQASFVPRPLRAVRTNRSGQVAA